MDWLVAPEYWLARLVFHRLLGVVYLVAFASVFNQFAALCGEHGLQPAPRYLRAAGFRRTPSLFHLRYSDRLARAAAVLGMVLSLAVVVGVVEHLPLGASMAVWLGLWALYLSFVNAGQIFFGFAWETLLLETGFLATFLGTADVAPLWPALLMLRWLLFRLEFGAGLIKVRSDPAWRDLTALRYHHETQPIPNRWSRAFHHLPPWVHRVEGAGNLVAQLVVPFGLLLPQPVAAWAGVVVVVTQLWLMASGNFAWLNVLTLTLAVTTFDDGFLGRLLPVDRPELATPPDWFTAVVLATAAVMLVLSWRPVRNMASRRQVMNASYNRIHLGNTYGLFGHITRERLEVIVEGTDDPAPGPATTWRAYEFKAKPGDPDRRPRQVAPYHLRLDWLMWFAALSPRYAEDWFVRLVARLLAGDRATLRLLARNPFPDQPPTFARAMLYRYHFTSRAERKATGAWWRRELVGSYLAPIALASAAGSASHDGSSTSPARPQRESHRRGSPPSSTSSKPIPGSSRTG